MAESTEWMTVDNICNRVYIIRGQLAEQQSIFIMRAFREMRHYIKQNQQFVTQSEMHLVSARVSEISVQMSNMADRQKKTEQDIQVIQKSIDTLNENFVSDKDFKNFVIYKGQKFEADYPKLNVLEDSVTGRAHTYTAPIWTNRIGKEVLFAKQLSKRGGAMTVQCKGNRVYLTGKVQLFMEGNLSLDV